MAYPAKNEPLSNPHSPQDSEPTTVATPEGDNEYPPDVPLGPVPDGLHTPPGYGKDGNVYNNDRRDQEPRDTAHDDRPSGIEKFIDEVARGEYM